MPPVVPFFFGGAGQFEDELLAVPAIAQMTFQMDWERFIQRRR